jgi:hypothetical protein
MLMTGPRKKCDGAAPGRELDTVDRAGRGAEWSVAVDVAAARGRARGED